MPALRGCRIKDIIRQSKKSGQGGDSWTRIECEIEVLPATVGAGRRPRPGRPRRPRTTPPRGRRARRSSARPAPAPSTPTPTSSRRRSAIPNTRKAYKRAVDRFLGWCQFRGLELRQVTSFVVGDYVEHHLIDKDGHPLSAPSKKQHLAAPPPLLRQPADVPRRRHQPRLQRPRPEVLRPRGQDARLRRQARSATSSTRRRRATSSGSATRRCS